MGIRSVVRQKISITIVSDKTQIVEFAQGFSRIRLGILSTGGTLRALKEHGIDAIGVSALTEFC